MGLVVMGLARSLGNAVGSDCGWRSFLRIGIVVWVLFVGASQANSQTIRPGISQHPPVSGPSVKVADGFMVPYEVAIPGTGRTFTMIPIPGGKFRMGSPDSETGRSADEGPQVEVEVEPFWMAKCEVTWGEYRPFMGLYRIFKQLQSEGVRRVNDSNLIDAITVPTPLYQSSHTFEFGEDPMQPAVTMTQYSAKQYAKWISGLVLQQLRLPSEAEWEYAARAGSTTPYSFGDDVAELKKYACFAETNSKGPSLVGQRVANAFGLHDMHGNVWEWTIDGYSSEGYKGLSERQQQGEKLQGQGAVQWSDLAYPRTVRGGGWQDPPERLRSAARLGSDDEDWKDEDPNVPRSPWWFTSDPARGIGFRLVRSYQDLDVEGIKRYWEYDHPDIELDVQLRMEEGRGARGLAVPDLMKDLEKHK